MKRFVILTLPLLALATPLAAQTANPATSATKAAVPPPSADRVEAAKPVIDKLWPLGTYRKMMDGQMSELMDAMMVSMLDMKAEDFLPEGEVPKKGKGKSIGELASEKDPHFRERFRIMTDVMFKEMAPIMDKAEPAVRKALTNDYARKYTPAELRDLDSFLGTPSGQVYAQNWITSFYSPEMMTAMKDAVPEIIKAMPTIMEKVEKATAHLPPPPKSETQKAAEEAAAAASEAATEAANEAESAAYESDKWSAADRQQLDQLRSERDKFYQQQDLIEARINLHALEAKERSGQKLDKYEVNQRDELRDLLKDKK